jgi:hypothetical protein
MNRTNLLTCAFVLVVAFARAGEFETANQLYDEGKFPEAKQHFEQLVARGEWTANLFHNLGNTDFRLGSPGRAMLNYERALALDRKHPEAQANLSLLRERSGSRVPSKQWGDWVFPKRATTALTLLGTIAGWMACFCLGFAATSRGRVTGLWFSAVVALCIGGFAVAALWWNAGEQAQAIVVASQVEARLAPTDTAAVAEVLPAGSEVRVLSERGEWVYCELPGAGRGWVSSRSVEKVRFAKT